MMFHNVLRVFHDVLLVVHDILQCFTCVSWCFTMFNNVLWCLASRAMIGVSASATTQPPIASGIATTQHGSAITPQKSAITPQKSAMAPQGSSISPRTWSHAKLLWLLAILRCRAERWLTRRATKQHTSTSLENTDKNCATSTCPDSSWPSTTTRLTDCAETSETSRHNTSLLTEVKVSFILRPLTWLCSRTPQELTKRSRTTRRRYAISHSYTSSTSKSQLPTNNVNTLQSSSDALVTSAISPLIHQTWTL